MKLEINGQVVEVDDSFEKLSDSEKEAAVNEIAASLRPAPKAKAASDTVNPLYGIGGGAIAANVLGRPINKYFEGIDKVAPPDGGQGLRVTPQNVPPEITTKGPDAVENWTRTQHAGKFYGGQDYTGAHNRAMDVKATLAETPGYSAIEGSGVLAPREAVQGHQARKAAEARRAMPLTERLMESSPAVGRTAAGASNVLRAGVPPFVGRTTAGGVAGYLGVDAYNRAMEGDIPGAVISGTGALGSGLALVPRPKVRGLGILGAATALGANALRDKEEKPKKKSVMEGYARGGLAYMAGGRKAAVEEGISAAKKLFTPKPTRVMRASEALGSHEGKRLGLTQTDNFGVHGGRMGGNQFPNFQNISPKHAEDRVVWMNDSERHANAMAQNSKFGDQDVIWSTYIGAPDQLKSNKTVWNDILEQHYKRNLTPEQYDLINKQIATLRPSKNKPLVFSQPFDIRDKFAVQELVDTFDKRSALASMLGEGKGVGGKRQGIAMPEYQDILRSHRDPLTEGVPTSSVGTRLFTVDPTPSRFSKEYHPDYEWPVYGQDMGVQFEKPVPQKLIVPDWYARTEAKSPGKNRTHGNAWFSYMKDPQQITHDLLMNLEKEGYKAGGLAGIN